MRPPTAVTAHARQRTFPFVAASWTAVTTLVVAIGFFAFSGRAVHVGEAAAVLGTVFLVLACHLAVVLSAGGRIGLEVAPRARAARAREAERRRIARDLHDGLAQELAYIAARADTEATGPDVAAAARRALAESRAVISGLSRPTGEALSESLIGVAEEVAGRAGANVRAVGTEDFTATDRLRESLVRIVREATTNAVNHGGASEIVLSVRRHHKGVWLSISDNGCGFDPVASRRGPGFGLQSMVERANLLGGSLAIESHPGEGCEIEVLVP